MESESLQEMKLLWEKLRAEAVPVSQWPLDAYLPRSVQLRAQAQCEAGVARHLPLSPLTEGSLSAGPSTIQGEESGR